MADDSILATIASIIAGFGAAMLTFRIQRELQMSENNEVTWIPWADWLLIFATIFSLLMVIFPIVTVGTRSGILKNLPAAGCSASSIMVTGYILGILAHYRLIFGKKRSGPRDNPEPAEKIITFISILFSVLSFFIVLFGIL
jgi:biopolymer transport protein ExbD